TAVADSYAAMQDMPLVVAAPGVLGNDTDPENDPLTADLVTPPTHGTLHLQLDGGFTYTPTVGYNGADSFTYRAYDAQAYSPPVTVQLMVTAVSTDTYIYLPVLRRP
ncbi:MAG: cadherin-like domain-containing protein, partial [Anaerolineales bacterium]|nr:cadherin-like domain-containing protein [Anaerolineales bacterium]